MFERPQMGDRALLVALDLGVTSGFTAQVSEFEDLARSAGADVVGVISGTRKQPDPRLFVGSGKAEEIAAAVVTHAADLVIFNHALAPSQERNLERELRCRVLDRSGLILDIFAQRARSHEGKLQVELAQLQHMSTRLVRGWTHLERQKGGIGLRGPGETQLETDRRLLAARIQHIQRRLEKVQRSREQGRQARRRNEIPTVALVGYTNAGKSTLFNALTAADVYAADQLFATLDPTLRKLDLAPQRSVILADTVGFVRDLPHELIAAFKATLTETREAALLLHVIDAADPERDMQTAEVEAVLAEIGAEDVPIWRIYNKIDCLPAAATVERSSPVLPTTRVSTAEPSAESPTLNGPTQDGLKVSGSAPAAAASEITVPDVTATDVSGPDFSVQKATSPGVIAPGVIAPGVIAPEVSAPGSLGKAAPPAANVYGVPAVDGNLRVSALTGAGLAELSQRLADYFSEEMFHGWIALPPTAGRIRARLYAEKAVEAEQNAEDGSIHLRIMLPERRLRSLLADTDLPHDPDQLRVEHSSEAGGFFAGQAVT